MGRRTIPLPSHVQLVDKNDVRQGLDKGATDNHVRRTNETLPQRMVFALVCQDAIGKASEDQTSNYRQQDCMLSASPDGVFGNIKGTDYVIALAAFAAAIFGFFQWRVYIRTASILDKQTDISERISTGEYWPHLMLRDARFRTLRSQWPAPGAPSVDFAIENVGPKTVIMKFFQHDLLFRDRLPEIPEWSAGWLPTYSLIVPGDRWNDASHFEDEINRELEQAMKGFDPWKRNWQFFLIIRTICEDVFGQQHEHAWCFRSSRGGGPGLPYGGPAYNYRRILKANERV